jgi:hypothetical protein
MQCLLYRIVRPGPAYVTSLLTHVSCQVTCQVTSLLTHVSCQVTCQVTSLLTHVSCCAEIHSHHHRRGAAAGCLPHRKVRRMQMIMQMIMRPLQCCTP